MFFQQGTQRIEVVVRKDSGYSNAGTNEIDPNNIGGDVDGKRGGAWATLTGSTSIARQHRVVKTNTTHFFATLKQITDLKIEHFISGIGQRNGDEALQDNINRTMEIVKDTTGLASSVAMGAVYGSWGGPIGTAMGMVLGLASTAASIGAKYANREREFNFKMFKENNAIEYKRARASINLTTGRLR